jgi:hypothetical protein
MERFVKKLLFACVFSMQLFSLRAAEGFRLPSIGTDDKNLYEMIGLDKNEYDRRRAAATQGIDTLKYDPVVAALQPLSQAKKLLQRLQEINQEKDRFERMFGSESLGAALNIQAEGISVEQAQEKLRELQGTYDYLLSQARELIKQERYKGEFDTWAKREITSKCKAAQRDIRKEIEKIEQEVKFYPAEQGPRLQKQLSKAKGKLKKLSEGCSFLINPKFRAQYDAEIQVTHPSSRAFENVKDSVESGMRLAGTGTRIKLNALIGDVLSRELNIPDASTKLFNQDLALSDIRVLPKPQGEDIKYYVGFTGTTTFNTFSLAINVYVIWDTYGKVRFSIGVATPDDYRLTNLFPSLRALNWMLFPKGKFVVANFEGTDVDGYGFKKGLNFLAEWDIFSGPLAFFKKLQTAAPKLEGLVFEADPVSIEAQIPKNPMFTELTAKVPLYIGLDFTKMSKLPNAFTRVINSIKLGGLELTISPSAPRLEVQENNVLAMKRKMERAQSAYEQMRAVRIVGDEKAQIARIEKAEREYSAAKRLYESEKRRVAGITKDRQQVTDKEAERRVREAGRQPTVPIVQRAEVIPSRVPTKYRQGVTDAQRGIVQREAALEQFEKFGFTVQAQAEGVLQLGTQPDPLRLIVSGLVRPPGLKHPQGFISLAARLDNMLEFGWLAIGNAGIVLDIDVAAVEALIAFGIPISGIFINGQVDLGKPGESRASLKAGGGISITAKKPVDALVFDVSGDNIRPTDFARFIGYQLMKSQSISAGVGKLSDKSAQLYNRLFPKSGGAPTLSLPELIFHKVWGYAALGSATIGRQTYRSGLGLQVEIELMKQKAGMKIFIADQEEGYALEGFGYGPPLHLSIKGRDLIRLYSAQDPSKGPYITWNFNPKVLFSPSSAPSRLQAAQAKAGALKEDLINGAMSLDAVLELPMMGLKQKARFNWAGYTIDADFETELGGYTLLFGVKLNTKGDEVDEGAFIGKLNEVRSKLSQKKSTDKNTVAALFLLRTAESQSTALGMQLLDQALNLLSNVEGKSADTRAVKQRAKEKATGIARATREAYAQRGVRGVVGAGVSGLKSMVFEVPEEIPYETQVQAAQLFKAQSMLAEFEALKQEADKNGIDINTSLASENKAFQDVQSGNDQKEMKKALAGFKTALNEQLTEIKPDIGLQNWQGMLVKFGFKNVNQLSKQISEQLVPYLNRLKDSYTKRIAAIDAKAQRWETGDIDTTKEKEAIARRQAKIAKMKEICSKRSRLNQVACQSKIKFEQSKLLKDKAILNAFIESKISKDAKRMAAIGYRKSQVGKALKVAGQKALGAVTATAQAIAKGIDVLNITEILGQYSYRDMVNLRLPRLVRLVAELNMMDMKIPIVLQNLQFDFRNPMQSVQAIAHALFDAMHRTMQKEFMADMPPEMQELLGEAMGM